VGFNSLLGSLEQAHGRATSSAQRQREGILGARGATALMHALETELRTTHLPHIARAARAASVEQPDLVPPFRYSRDLRTIRRLRTALDSIGDLVEQHRDVLVRYGLVESVLEDFQAKKARYDQAVMQGVEARRQHVGASADLDRAADEIVRIVKQMDGYQRMRYAKDPDRLAAWLSASSVTGDRPPADKAGQDGQPGGGAPAGDVRPAA
jgi:hypothetical protein